MQDIHGRTALHAAATSKDAFLAVEKLLMKMTPEQARGDDRMQVPKLQGGAGKIGWCMLTQSVTRSQEHIPTLRRRGA